MVRYGLGLSAMDAYETAKEAGNLKKIDTEIDLGDGIKLPVTVEANQDGLPNVGYVIEGPDGIYGALVHEMPRVGWVPSQLEDDFDI
jgi:hypothetical protein